MAALADDVDSTTSTAASSTIAKQMLPPVHQGCCSLGHKRITPISPNLNVWVSFKSGLETVELCILATTHTDSRFSPSKKCTTIFSLSQKPEREKNPWRVVYLEVTLSTPCATVGEFERWRYNIPHCCIRSGWLFLPTTGPLLRRALQLVSESATIPSSAI